MVSTASIAPSSASRPTAGSATCRLRRTNSDSFSDSDRAVLRNGGRHFVDRRTPRRRALGVFAQDPHRRRVSGIGRGGGIVAPAAIQGVARRGTGERLGRGRVARTVRRGSLGCPRAAELECDKGRAASGGTG